MTDKLAALKREQYRQGVIKAYEHSVATGLTDHLWKTVKEFAKMKMYRLERAFHDVGTAETVDDWAQDVVFDVWQQLATFKGDGAAFYRWVTTIIRNHRSDAKYGHDRVVKDGKITKLGRHSLLHKRLKTTRFTVTTENEEGEQTTEENPEVTASFSKAPFGYTLPEHLMTVHERRVCNYITIGFTYAQIAEELDTTESAVKQTIMAVRRRVAAERGDIRADGDHLWSELETPRQRQARDRVDEERPYRRPQSEIDAPEADYIAPVKVIYQRQPTEAEMASC